MNLYRTTLDKDGEKAFYYVEANAEDEAIEEAERMNPGWKIARSTDKGRTQVPDIQLLGNLS
jgi:hypothetical protein